MTDANMPFCRRDKRQNPLAKLRPVRLVFPMHMKTPLKFVAVVGLALGGIFGMAGTMVVEPEPAGCVLGS